jgi:hypothetical protein
MKIPQFQKILLQIIDVFFLFSLVKFHLYLVNFLTLKFQKINKCFFKNYLFMVINSLEKNSF